MNECSLIIKKPKLVFNFGFGILPMLSSFYFNNISLEDFVNDFPSPSIDIALRV